MDRNDKLEVKIIKEVIAKEVLYNPELYESRKALDLAWEEVADKLGMRADELKRRWRNLKDCYIKHLRTREPDFHEGAKKWLKRYESWPWAELMAPFKPFVKKRRQFISDKIEENAEYYDETAVESILEETKDPEEQVLKEEQLDIEYELDNETKTYLDSTKEIHFKTKRPRLDSSQLFQFENRTTEYDDVDLLFLGYAKTVKKFSLERQALFKFKLAKLMKEEELAHIREDPLNQ